MNQFLMMLDPDPDEAGRKYIRLRNKLIWYFVQHGINDAEEAADETVQRTLEKIQEGAQIDPLQAYCFGIARFVCMELHKKPGTVALDPDVAYRSVIANPAASLELRMELEDALGELGEENATMLLEYAAGDRDRLALKLGISPNALRIRVSREREKLAEIMKRRKKGGTK